MKKSKAKGQPQNQLHYKLICRTSELHTPQPAQAPDKQQPT